MTGPAGSFPSPGCGMLRNWAQRNHIHTTSQIKNATRKLNKRAGIYTWRTRGNLMIGLIHPLVPIHSYIRNGCVWRPCSESFFLKHAARSAYEGVALCNVIPLAVKFWVRSLILANFSHFCAPSRQIIFKTTFCHHTNFYKTMTVLIRLISQRFLS
jgi:hypothetical protein